MDDVMGVFHELKRQSVRVDELAKRLAVMERPVPYPRYIAQLGDDPVFQLEQFGAFYTMVGREFVPLKVTK